MTSTQVLIVGGGPIGMATGLMLDRLGIESIIIEKRDGITDHPKSRGCWARTMEAFRVWGIEDEVRAGGLPEFSDVEYICESGVGRVYGISQPQPFSFNTPSQKSLVAQDVVERALDDRIGKIARATMRRGSEVVRFEQFDDYVTATIRDLDTSEEETLEARYLLGCDGVSSSVRGAMGVEVDRTKTLAHLATYFYKADLSHLPHLRRMVGIEVLPSLTAEERRAQAEGAPPIMDRKGGLILSTGNDANRWLWLQWRDNADQPLLREDEVIPLFRTHWGVPDLDIELLSVQTWTVFTQIPESFRRGRVFLVGDAAHSFPSTGGMGMNSGIQDVQNLCWKLAYVLRGHAHPDLLDTYTAERLPVAHCNAKWSQSNLDRRYEWQQALQARESDPDRWHSAIVDLENHMHSEGIVLGQIYSSNATIDDGSRMPTFDPRYYWPTDRPGARFPHMWLDAQHTASTIDWFDTNFVLVTGPDADDWRAAASSYAGAVKLDIRTLPTMAGPFTIESDGAILIRPDGHVAWRPDPHVHDKADALRGAMVAVVNAHAGTP